MRPLRSSARHHRVRAVSVCYKLRSPPKLGGAPLYMGFLYGVKIARLDDYMGFLYGAPPDLTVHFWAQKTQNNVSQKAQMLLQKIVTDSLPPPRFTASTTTLVSLPGRKPVLTTLARVPDPVVRVWTARKICVANPTQKKKICYIFPSPHGLGDWEHFGFCSLA